MKNLFLFKIGLLILLCVLLSCTKEGKPNAPTSKVKETSNSISGIWFETSFSPNGKTFKSYHAIIQLDSADYVVTQITSKKDILEGKVKETLFQDTENNQNLYKGLYVDNEDVSFYKIKDIGTSKAVFMNYIFQKNDNNTLTGTWTFSPNKGKGKYVVKVKWERLRDSFDLVNDFGETIRTIK